MICFDNPAKTIRMLFRPDRRWRHFSVCLTLLFLSSGATFFSSADDKNVGAPTTDDLLDKIDKLTVGELVSQMRRANRLDLSVGQPLLKYKAQANADLADLELRIAQFPANEQLLAWKDKIASDAAQKELARINSLRSPMEMKKASADFLQQLQIPKEGFLRASQLVVLEREAGNYKKLLGDIDKRLKDHESKGVPTAPKEWTMSATGSFSERRKALENALNNRAPATAKGQVDTDSDDVLEAIRRLAN